MLTNHYMWGLGTTLSRVFPALSIPGIILPEPFVCVATNGERFAARDVWKV